MNNDNLPANVGSNDGLGVWQPIETAPRDGKTFLAARFKPDEDEPDYEIGSYAPMTWDRYEPADNGLFRKVSDIVCEWNGFNNFYRMTHWAPLPVPPETPNP